VLDPPGAARQDWWIIQDIAQRLGLKWNYGGPADIYAEMARAMPSLENITWQRLEREGSVTYPAEPEGHKSHDIIFTDGFPTPSGRARIVPADVAPPDEVPDDEYDMVLSTGRVLEHWHTGAMTRRANALDEIEPEAVAMLSPQEIARRKLRAGEMIRVETRRGAVEIKLRADHDVPANMIFIPFCYAEAAANILTNPALDPFGKIPEFKFCAARIAAVS
jgi:formate dehydrogenase major subunit